MRKLRKHEIKKENEIQIVQYGNHGFKWWRRCWEYTAGKAHMYYQTDINGCGVWFCDDLNHRRIEIAAPFQFCTSNYKNPFVYVKRMTDRGCCV